MELLADKGALSLDSIRDEIFRPDSFWLTEGRNLLIEEFGKDYSTYFSILSLIASGKTSRSEIESFLEKSVGGYLERLINDYQVIKVVKPMFSKPKGKNIKYEITDNFLSFWFRFVFKYESAIEIENFEYLRSIFDRDFKTYSGKVLAKWFVEQWKQSGQFTQIGNYWDRRGNEIDLVGMDEREKTIRFAEVKLNKKNYKPEKLKEKARPLLEKIPDYRAEYQVLGLEEIS